MGKRRRARELGMQALFSMDLGHSLNQRQFEIFLKCFQPPATARGFFNELITGVMKNWDFINNLIERYSSHWKVSRMAGVDRNILRIAVYELLFRPDIPPKVSINEAIDIGKKFGTEESGGFINGILDSVRLALESGEIKPETDYEEFESRRSYGGQKDPVERR